MAEDRGIGGKSIVPCIQMHRCAYKCSVDASLLHCMGSDNNNMSVFLVELNTPIGR